MAKKSQIARNKKRKRLAANQAEQRKELRKLSIDPDLSTEDRRSAQVKLQSLPRNGAPSRIVNRCAISGRRRGFYRKFGISRIVLREMAHEGLIPGVRKSSW
jgi:small subunit ribosomal protein S14